MVELNFFDSNGNVVINLPDLASIQTFFKQQLNVSNPSELIMDLMTNHSRLTVDDVLYYYKTVNISNTHGTIKIGYAPVKDV